MIFSYLSDCYPIEFCKKRIRYGTHFFLSLRTITGKIDEKRKICLELVFLLADFTSVYMLNF